MIPINSWNSELEVSLKQLEHIWIRVFESRCMDWIEQELGKLLDRLGIRKVHVVKTFRHGESVPRSQLFPKQRETKGSVGMLSFWMVWTFRLFWLVQLNWVTKVMEEYGYPATGLKLECFPPHLDNFTIALGALHEAHWVLFSAQSAVCHAWKQHMLEGSYKGLINVECLGLILKLPL